jgi:hypothetical protein
MPTATDLVTDLPADFEVFGQAVDTRLKALQPGTTLGDIAYSSATANTNTRLPIGTNGQVLGVSGGVPAWVSDATGMTNPMTTTGDTIYSSSGSTPARLGIGSTGQVMTVAGGVPTWAAPSASLDNYTLINTGGTALTGANTFTISGISGKNSILIIADDFSTSAGNSEFRVRLNTDTGSNYSQSGLQLKDASTAAGLNIQNGTSFWVAQAQSNALGTYYLKMGIFGTGSSGYKFITGSTMGDWGTLSQMNTFNATYKGTSAITSITFFSNGANFDAGTIYVYGA